MKKKVVIIDGFKAITDKKGNEYTINLYKSSSSNEDYNLYRWNPEYQCPRGTNKNSWECPEDILIRAFAALFPEVKKYQDVYYEKFGGSKKNSKKMSLMESMLRKQTEIIKQQAAMISQQAEMIAEQTEYILSIDSEESIAEDNVEVIEDFTSELDNINAVDESDVDANDDIEVSSEDDEVIVATQIDNELLE